MNEKNTWKVKRNAWKVEPKLIDRFLNVLDDNGFKWESGERLKHKPWHGIETVLFIEGSSRTITYSLYRLYLDFQCEEYEITEVTEELLDEMEDEGVAVTIMYDNDGVDHPDHYNRSEIETIKIIEMLLTEEEYRGFLKGNILKYRERAQHKGNAEQDYAKALWYYKTLIGTGEESGWL